MTGVLAGVAAAAAVLLWLARTRPRLPRAQAGPPAPSDWVRRGRRAWPLLAGVAGWSLWSGPGALVVGALAAVLVHHLVAAAEPAAARIEREAMRRELPVLVLLLATVLRGGAALGPAARQVCAALPGAASARFAAACDRMLLGAAPEQVWAELAEDAGLAPLGRVLARAQRTGAPVAAAVERLADDLSEAARSEVEDRARAVGVRAAVPLGVCLLPSFLLLGIVPLVVTLLGQVRL